MKKVTITTLLSFIFLGFMLTLNADDTLENIVQQLRGFEAWSQYASEGNKGNEEMQKKIQKIREQAQQARQYISDIFPNKNDTLFKSEVTDEDYARALSNTNFKTLTESSTIDFEKISHEIERLRESILKIKV